MNGNNYYSLFEEEIEYKDTKEKNKGSCRLVYDFFQMLF